MSSMPSTHLAGGSRKSCDCDSRMLNLLPPRTYSTYCSTHSAPTLPNHPTIFLIDHRDYDRSIDQQKHDGDSSRRQGHTASTRNRDDAGDDNDRSSELLELVGRTGPGRFDIIRSHVVDALAGKFARGIGRGYHHVCLASFNGWGILWHYCCCRWLCWWASREQRCRQQRISGRISQICSFVSEHAATTLA